MPFSPLRTICLKASRLWSSTAWGVFSWTRFCSRGLHWPLCLHRKPNNSRQSLITQPSINEFGSMEHNTSYNRQVACEMREKAEMVGGSNPKEYTSTASSTAPGINPHRTCCIVKTLMASFVLSWHCADRRHWLQSWHKEKWCCPPKNNDRKTSEEYQNDILCWTTYRQLPFHALNQFVVGQMCVFTPSSNFLG